MLSTPLNNRKFDKKVVSANRSSASYKKRDSYNRIIASSTPVKKPAAKSLIQRKHAQSEDKLTDQLSVDQLVASEIDKGEKGSDDVRVGTPTVELALE